MQPAMKEIRAALVLQEGEETHVYGKVHYRNGEHGRFKYSTRGRAGGQRPEYLPPQWEPITAAEAERLATEDNVNKDTNYL